MINQDTVYQVSERRPARGDTITVKIPRDIFSSPEVVKMMDRHKTSTYGAVGITASILKSCKTVDDKDVNLNDFIISRTSAQHKMPECRRINAKVASSKFLENIPEILSSSLFIGTARK